jgi:hypothetical protein
VLVVVSLVSSIYYFAAVALTGADFAILASRLVFLVGDINVVQWLVQLGLLSVVPLLALHALEAGAARALWRTLKMFAMLSPVFFMFEIATKAYHFDAALTFGRQGYLATGRDFVIRHLSCELGRPSATRANTRARTRTQPLTTPRGQSRRRFARRRTATCTLAPRWPSCSRF